VKLGVGWIEFHRLVQVLDCGLTGTYGEILQRSGVMFFGWISLDFLPLCPSAAREGDEAEWEQPAALQDAQGEEPSPHHEG
jgi:hypothetical protein